MSFLYIVWNNEYDFRIPIIDDQHRTLVSIINTLFYFKSNENLSSVFPSLLQMLEDYGKIHFFTEESLLKEISYPDLDHHIALHEKYAKRIRYIINNQSNASVVNFFDVFQFLRDWWLDHINVEDRRYAPMLREDLSQ